MEPLQNPMSQNVPQGAMRPESPITQSPIKKTHIKSLVILVIVLVIIGGIAVSASKLGFFSSPEQVVKDAFLKLEKVNTLHSNTKIGFEYESPAGTQKAEVTIVADADKTDIKKPIVDSSIEFTGLGFTGDAKFKVINDTVYIKIDQLALLAKSPVPILGKWLSITEADIEKLSKEYGVASSSLDKIKDRNIMSVAEFYSIAEKYNVIESVSSSGVSSKDGLNVKSYSIVLNKSGLSSVLAEISQKNQKSTNIPSDQIKKYFDSMLSMSTLDPIIVDVGVIDGTVHGFQSSIVITNKVETPSNIKTPTTARVNIAANYSKMGDKVNISVPEESTPLVDLLSLYLAPARKKGIDAGIRASLSNIRAQAELFYNKASTYAGLCTSTANGIQDTFKYIKDKSGVDVICKASAKAYAVSGQLTDGTYSCVDSSGAFITIPKAPVGTSCK